MQETINYKRPTYSSAYTQGCQTSQINGRFSYEYFISHRSHETCSPPEGAKGNLTKAHALSLVCASGM